MMRVEAVMGLSNAARTTQSGLSTLFVAIDGGGSKTECLISDRSGNILGYGRGGPINVSFVDVDVAQESFRMALSGATRNRRLAVSIVAFAATTSQAVAQPVVDEFLDYRQFINTREAAACLASATSDAHGAVVLAGTGAFQWARNRNDETWRTDGWGSFVGDQGSAYDIVRRAFVAAARAVDGRGSWTALVDKFCCHFQATTLREVTGRVNPTKVPRHEIAALAPLVSQIAETDPVARSILVDSGKLLAEGLISCIKQVKMLDSEFHVALSGGVFNAGDSLIAPIRDELAHFAPGGIVVRPLVPPVIGALCLALHAGSCQNGEILLQHLAEQYKELEA
jgi:N-acetylglucosamine kinase-like BadF-type ATPase